MAAASPVDPLYTAQALYPNTSEAAAKHFYLGRKLGDVQAPLPVLDVAKVRKNCELMLRTTKLLGVSFRAHIKTHKTTQLAQLQVGPDSHDIRLIVSTVAEVENVLPWLLESKANGKKVNVLYGLPAVPSAIPRLTRIARLLGAGSIGFIVDHKNQIELLEHISDWPSGTVPVLPKIDVGYHRAGVEVGTKQMEDLARSLAATKQVQLVGFYSHMGQSYSVSSPVEALQHFVSELELLRDGAVRLTEQAGLPLDARYVLSLGATPTATAIQNLDDDHKAMATIRAIRSKFELEIHAGVYPVLDMQQLATRARPKHVDGTSETLLSSSNLALRVLVEVASVYDERGRPEALIAAGSIVLGREPCKSYQGWGVVTTWPAESGQTYEPEGAQTGWIVDRISQEHGVLQWHGSTEHFRPLAVGDKLLIWPNHACMAGPNFGFYAVVDSGSADADKIVDIWVRSRGW